MKNETLIRPAGFQDAGAIFTLIQSCADTLLPRSLGDLTQNIDRCLVAEKQKNVIGTVSWQILPEIGLSGNPSVEIKSLAVQITDRGCGVGRRLVTEAIAHISVFCPREIIALTFTPDFFSSLGFVRTSKERLMHKLYTGCMNCTRYDSPFTCPEIAMMLTFDAGQKNKEAS